MTSSAENRRLKSAILEFQTPQSYTNARPSPTSMAESSDTPGAGAPATLHTVLRLVGLLVIALMLVAIVYSGWISAVNWSEIGV